MLKFTCEKEMRKEISQRFAKDIADEIISLEIQTLAGDYNDKDLLENIEALVKLTKEGFDFDKKNLLGKEPYGYVDDFFGMYLQKLEELKEDYPSLGIDGEVSMNVYGGTYYVNRKGVHTTPEMQSVEFYDILQCVVCHKLINMEDAYLLLKDGEWGDDIESLGEDIMPCYSNGSGSICFCVCSEECEKRRNQKRTEEDALE